MDAILTLHDLRERMGVTQEELARALDVSQTNASKTEHEQDMYISTIGKYVEALGGKLELCAVFPDQAIRLGLIAPHTEDERVKDDPSKTAVG